MNARWRARELTVFRVVKQEFGIDIKPVRVFRGWIEAIPLPGTPSFVRGAFSLRGMVPPIFDLAAGILDDEESDILDVTSDLIQPRPDVFPELKRTFVRGAVAASQRMISLIALDQIPPVRKRAAA